MDLRNPVNSLTFALLHGLEVGLTGVPNDIATGLLGAVGDGPRRRRPHARECQVVMFAQSMRMSDIGFTDAPRADDVEGDTVIVLGPEGDACVYFAAQFVYHVRRPNRRFFLDVAAQSMAGRSESKAYDGRDSEEAESVDYCVEMDLSRLQAAVAHEPTAKPALIASLLRAYADRFDRMATRSEHRSQQ